MRAESALESSGDVLPAIPTTRPEVVATGPPLLPTLIAGVKVSRWPGCRDNTHSDVAVGSERHSTPRPVSGLVAS